jgi:hypothetical protein
VFIATTAVLGGCASTQVNYNTLDIASTYDQLITKQVTFNLQKTLDNKDGLPAFVKITAQTATTQNTISPSATIPWTSQITKLAQASVAPAGTTIQDSETSQLAGRGLSFAATDQWNQSYTLSPVQDTDQIRRLRTIYQFVTRTLPSSGLPLGNSTEDFECQYDMLQASTGGTDTNTQKTTLTITVDGKPVTVTQSTAPPPRPRQVYLRRAYVTDVTEPDETTILAYGWVPTNPDVTFITLPGCVLCDYGEKPGPKDKEEIREYTSLTDADISNAHLLRKNRNLRDDWLYLPGEVVGQDAVALPSNGLTTLYVKNDGMMYFYELALFTLDAASEGTGSPSSFGQSAGRKTAPPTTLNIPVGGITPFQ